MDKLPASGCFLEPQVDLLYAAQQGDMVKVLQCTTAKTIYISGRDKVGVPGCCLGWKCKVGMLGGNARMGSRMEMQAGNASWECKLGMQVRACNRDMQAVGHC